ncbi:hypothetical protein ACFQYP_24650 [Nonomuraea antimicrobica]
MRSTKRAAILTAAVVTATAPLLAVASPALAEQPAKTTQAVQTLPLEWLLTRSPVTSWCSESRTCSARATSPRR